MLCLYCRPQIVGRVQSVYGALAWDDYELLWDSISEDKAKDDEQGQGILPGRFTPEHPLK